MARRNLRLRRADQLSLSSCGWISPMLVVIVVAGSVAPAARADNRATATAVVAAQLALLEKQAALNKCLAASPNKNTPCTRQKSLSLATLAGRHIKLIQSAMDGTEIACVRTVAKQEINFLQIWRDGALALYRNQRPKAKRLFTQSLEISAAQAKVQPRCFAEALAGDGP